jgi:hypothetical protein
MELKLPMAKRFEEFLEAVRDSVEGQAKRKNYSENGVAGENKLSEVGRLLEFEPQHGIGEIVYKCAEYLKNPREVLLIKIAGWAGVLWMRHHGSLEDETKRYFESVPEEPADEHCAAYASDETMAGVRPWTDAEIEALNNQKFNEFVAAVPPPFNSGK